MFDRVQALEDEFVSLEASMSDPDLVSDQARLRDVTRRYKDLTPVVDCIRRRKALLADELTRPLLLVHGLADDNVVAAHTLQLSNALLAAGKPHEVLPLVGVTHMTPQETVAENLLLHQLEFLRRSLGLGPTSQAK